MLSISHMSLGGEKYYLSLAVEDYYLEGGEPEGRWLGEGCRHLKLGGTVEPEQLKQLMRGFSPEGKALVQNAGKTSGKLERKPGWDLTFSAPKSVSVLWAQLEPDARTKLQKAHLAAVRRAVKYIEDNVAYARIGKGGSELVPAKLVVAAFEHSTSRALDPQLHTHCLLLNLGFCPDSNVRALLSKPFYQHKMLAGAIYRLEFAHILEQELGLAIEQNDTSFEVAGISKDVRDAFSKRRKQIEKELGKKGVETASAAALANLATRAVKDVVPARSELFDRWRHESSEVGFTLSKARELLGKGRAKTDRYSVLRRSLSEGVESLESIKSYFSRKDLMLEVAHQLQASGVTPDYFLSQFDKEVADSSRLHNLGTRSFEQYFTTSSTLESERLLTESLNTLKDRKLVQLSKKKVEKLLSKPIQLVDKKGSDFSLELNSEQAEAVQHLVLGDATVRVVTGLAGTGKTTMLAATRQAYEAQGYEVIGLTPTHRARQELQAGAGIPTDTLKMRLLQIYPEKKYLVKHHLRQLTRAARKKWTYKREKLKLSQKKVLVLDEASMVTTGDMQLLVKAVEEQGARLIVVGDDKQLPPVGPGAAFTQIINMFGSSKLVKVERQEKDWAKKATIDISEARVEDFLRAYAEKGFLNVSETSHELEEKIIKDWEKAGGAEDPDSHVIAASTNKQVDALNLAAQQVRLKAGQLESKKRLMFDDTTFYVGDKIKFQKNSRKLRVFNGDEGIILGIRDWGWTKAIAVKIDVPKKSLKTKATELLKHSAIQLLRQAPEKPTFKYRPNDDDIRLIPLETIIGRTKFAKPDKHDQRPAFRLSYADTVHKLQGATIDNMYVALGDSMTDKEMSYVQGSRHKKTLNLYTTEHSAGEVLTQLARGTLAPPKYDYENKPVQQPLDGPLKSQLERSRRQEMAHELAASIAEQNAPPKVLPPTHDTSYDK